MNGLSIKKTALILAVACSSIGFLQAEDNTEEQQGFAAEQTAVAVAPAGFTEDFSLGLSSKRWALYLRSWLEGSNGCVPELVSIEQDVVDGVKKNVVVLTTQGNQTKSKIGGCKPGNKPATYKRNTDPKRVGAAISTMDSYASCAFEAKIKVGRPLNKQNAVPSGLCFSMWTFHYEDHQPAASDPTGSKINPNDPLYQPRFKIKDGGYYSCVVSEIDSPEFGQDGQWHWANYDNYLSEPDNAGSYKEIEFSNFGIDIMDGKYHTYRTEWHTTLVPTKLKDSQVIAKGDRFYAADSPTSNIQGFAVTKKSDGIWYVYQGATLDYFVDGKKVGRSTKRISPVSARIIIGGWLPNWCGTPNWDTTKIYISSVKVTPYNDEGDIYFQPETWPMDGLVAPAASLYFGK
jgi:hypothetical protein